MMIAAEPYADDAEQSDALPMWQPGSPTLADVFAELLNTIADVLDIRTVFPRVSAIVNKLLSHDSLALWFIDEQGRFIERAASTDDVSGISRLIERDARHSSEIII